MLAIDQIEIFMQLFMQRYLPTGINRENFAVKN